MKEMLVKDFLPSLSGFAASTAEQAAAMKAFVSSVPTGSAQALVADLGNAYEEISQKLEVLEKEISEIDTKASVQEAADYCHDTVLATMDELRKTADAAEEKLPEEALSYPTYDKLLFSV